jgi:hypothetical protein
MEKKITIGMFFFMLVSINIYSQIVQTINLELMIGVNDFRDLNESRDTFIKSGLGLGSLPSFEGFTITKRLPNSVVNEIDLQLVDYSPLNNGEMFLWTGFLMSSRVSGQAYNVFLRITDARNSKWEYYAYMKYISVDSHR